MLSGKIKAVKVIGVLRGRKRTGINFKLAVQERAEKNKKRQESKDRE